MAEKFYLTTPIFYPNAKLHMGHAYTTTLSDILVRYKRLKGEETYFLTGSDENTQKVVAAAAKAGKETQAFLDDIVENFKNLFTSLNISYDQFIRTSDSEVHWPGAQELWKRLVEAGDIYQKEYEGLYCVGHEAFITEKELVDGKCPDHDMAPTPIREVNYFFKLSKYTHKIKEKIESNELAITPPSRRHEILTFLSEGLEDISFSRPRLATSVGVPVPGDINQVMYVWCDALSNYITAVGFGRDEEEFKRLWPADVHVIGKDILRFHAAIWPGMLLSAGLPLPKSLLVHGFITSGGKKMSKTIGNVIDPEELIAEYGTDAVRYFLARHISPFEDGDLTREGFKDAYNANLANGLGNLVARIMKLAEDNLEEGTRPAPEGFDKEYIEAIEKYEVNRALDYVFSLVTALDGRITTEQPFKVVKTDPEKGKEIIKELTQELYTIARMLNPFLPETSQKIKDAIVANKKPDTLFPRND